MAVSQDLERCSLWQAQAAAKPRHRCRDGIGIAQGRIRGRSKVNCCDPTDTVVLL
jgi:hypothetical protein